MELKSCYYVDGRITNGPTFNRQYLINNLGTVYDTPTIKKLSKPFWATIQEADKPFTTPQAKQEPAPADNGPANAEKMANIECTVQEMIERIDCGELETIDVREVLSYNKRHPSKRQTHPTSRTTE